MLHTGDWKLDGDPVVGVLTDEERLKAYGREGVLALVGDSTGAMVATPTPSEKEVQRSFKKMFGSFKSVYSGFNLAGSKRIIISGFGFHENGIAGRHE